MHAILIFISSPSFLIFVWQNSNTRGLLEGAFQLKNDVGNGKPLINHDVKMKVVLGTRNSIVSFRYCHGNRKKIFNQSSQFNPLTYLCMIFIRWNIEIYQNKSLFTLFKIQCDCFYLFNTHLVNHTFHTYQ